MNKKLLFVLLLLLLVLSLSACGFVRYMAYGEGSEVEAEAPDSPEEYLALLGELLYPNANEDQQSKYSFLLLDAENAFLECTDADDMAEVYEEYAALLLQLTKEVVREEIGVLAASQVYRAAEQLTVDALVAEYAELAADVENGTDALALFYQFKTELGEIKTDAILYAEELVVLKKERSESFANINYAPYRDTQRTQIRTLVEQFGKGLADLDTKEECEALYAAYCDTLTRLPKAADLLARERAEVAAYWQNKLAALADKYSLSLDAEIAALVGGMASTTVAAANRAGGEFLLAHFGAYATREELAEAAATVIENIAADLRYRTTDAEAVQDIRDAAQELLLQKNTADEMLSLIGDVKEDVAAVPTNDDRWAEELTAFRAALTQSYGPYVLREPSSLTVANSYLELGKIIDYYAFYQLNGSSFVCGSFRVQLNFPHRYAEWELIEMHWYCELIRSAVGLLGSFEEDSSQMVFTLVPYAFATETNREGEIDINRHPTMIEFDSDPSTQTVRGEDFEAFPYLSLYTERLEGVWNSQQLWYALEHEYLPVVVPGSPAERVLERAKEILRTVIRDGMSTEEKIFRIYSWFAVNVEYDYAFSLKLDHPDRHLLPDHNTAVLNSFHIEGSLFDGLAVCCGYAKAYLLLLRMEGIESYRLALNYDSSHAISFEGGYGSHAIVAVRASDGKFYYSDVEQSFARGNALQSYHQLLVPHSLQNTYHNATNKVFAPYLDFGTELPAVMWEKLLYNGKRLLLRSETELKAMLDDFADHPNKDEMLMLYVSPGCDFSAISNILADGRFELWEYVYNEFYEYFIYPAK